LPGQAFNLITNGGFAVRLQVL